MDSHSEIGVTCGTKPGFRKGGLLMRFYRAVSVPLVVCALTMQFSDAERTTA